MIETPFRPPAAEPLSPVALPRLGLCCTFSAQPEFRFRTTTIAHLSRLLASDPSGDVPRRFYEALVAENLVTLERVLAWCAAQGIHAFRIGSDLWPRATHPMVTGWVDALMADEAIQSALGRIRRFATAADIRLSEHPDQFLVGNSLREDVVLGTIAELEWRARLGATLGVDVLCLHVGSGAPDRESALARWEGTLARLSPAVLARLAFENDDRVFTPEDILPWSMAWAIPLIYDAHHHRVNPDSLTEEEATEFAIASWGAREPYFHLSSPRGGWDGGDPRPHHHAIDVDDWPTVWTELLQGGARFTVDIEAKAKEEAVLALRAALQSALPTGADVAPTARERESEEQPGCVPVA